MFTSDFRTITELKLIPEDLFYVTVNGKVVDWQSLDEGAHFQVHFRLRGGKGGLSLCSYFIFIVARNFYSGLTYVNFRCLAYASFG